MDENLTKEEIVVMAAACIAEDIGTDISNIQISNFREVKKSSLEQFIADNKINYRKYQLGD